MLYSELVKHLSDGKPLRLGFAVLTKTKLPELTVHALPADPYQMQRTKRIVEQVWRAIQSGHLLSQSVALELSRLSVSRALSGMERVALTDPRTRGGEMPKRVLIEEFHLSVFVPHSLPEAESTSIYRALNGKRFRAELKQSRTDASCAGIRRLKKIHVTITR